MAARKTRIAIAYDFDGTLSPGNMQEYDFIPKLGVKPKAFWKEAKKLAKDNQMDEILAYMYLMVKMADGADISIKRQDFVRYGKTVELFKGVDTWFDRVNRYAASMNDAIVEHHIISSGLKEMIEGTKVKKFVDRIYASSFYYDRHGVAKWPALALNYTTKTQFLFRISKDVHELSENSQVNEFVPDDKRHIPFSNIIYIGDGDTDVPCMRMVKVLGGHAIAVYRPGSNTRKPRAEKLLENDRVDFVLPADYSQSKKLELVIQNIIDKIGSASVVSRMPKKQRSSKS